MTEQQNDITVYKDVSSRIYPRKRCKRDEVNQTEGLAFPL